MSAKTIVAIVDPFSSGSQLAREVRARGHACYMVQSAESIPAMYRSSFHAEDFDAIIPYRGNLNETSAELQAANVGCVVAGCEMGVELADHLSERLGLASNGTRLTAARRNKSLMVDVLRQHGIRTPSSFSSSRLDSVKEWLGSHGKWPVVLKPLSSSGSDGVCLCNTEAEVELAFDRIVSRVDVFGSANHAVLVQEYALGTEYAVDTVSCAGQHKVVAVWQYGKNLPREIFFGSDTLELLPHRASLDRQFTPYVTSVLDALEVKHGPAHCELIATREGPVIVEIGARLNGGNNPMLSRYCGGETQMELTLDSYLDPQRFLAQIDEPYKLAKGAMRVFLIPRQQGRLLSPPDFERIQRLDSFHELRFSAKPGQTLSRIAGWVLLVHEDRDVLHRDLSEIRRLETCGLYPIEAGS